MTDQREYDQAYARRAQANIEKWGMQELDVLLLALTEELGELTRAYLEHEHEGGPPEAIEHELVDMMALGYQIQWRLRMQANEPVPNFIEQ